MDEKERARALDLALNQIEKQFGKGSILRLGSKDAIVPVSVISTGSISLDAALGVGGLPRGRVNEIFGPESSGKTTIALQVIAEAQKAGGIAAFIDVEHALDPNYARKLGVDIDNLLVSQPDYGEQALEITNHLTSSGQIDVLVVDSVAPLVLENAQVNMYGARAGQPDGLANLAHGGGIPMLVGVEQDEGHHALTHRLTLVAHCPAPTASEASADQTARSITAKARSAPLPRRLTTTTGHVLGRMTLLASVAASSIKDANSMRLQFFTSIQKPGSPSMSPTSLGRPA